MPISAPWMLLVESVVYAEHDVAGAYELGSWLGAVIYIGSTGAVRERLLEHLHEPRGTCIRENAAQYRVEYTSDCERRARELFVEHVRRHGRPPRCNEEDRRPGPAS